MDTAAPCGLFDPIDTAVLLQPRKAADLNSTRCLQQSYRTIRFGFADAAGTMPSGTNEGILILLGARPPFLVLSLQKLDIHLRAVDADKFASAIGQAGRRQQQKELLEIEALNGALHREDGVGVRYGVEQAFPAPRTVNGHDADAISAAERDAF